MWLICENWEKFGDYFNFRHSIRGGLWHGIKKFRLKDTVVLQIIVNPHAAATDRVLL